MPRRRSIRFARFAILSISPCPILECGVRRRLGFLLFGVRRSSPLWIFPFWSAVFVAALDFSFLECGVRRRFGFFLFGVRRASPLWIFHKIRAVTLRNHPEPEVDPF